MSLPLSPGQVERFREDGYLLVPDLFDPEEMDLLMRTARADRVIESHTVGVDDGSGGTSRLSLWFKPEQNLYGMFSRCERIVGGIEQLLGAEVFHYHSKMMLKEPHTGGAWSWHQDYGYWYRAGFLYPDMASCLIAVDRATRANGCLQVLRGSHKMGRIDHVTVGGQTGAEEGRLEIAFQRFERVYCEMDPGTAFFFHANTLHGSDQNRSENPRWSLICCYSAVHNTSCLDQEPPDRLEKVPDGAIKAMGPVGFAAESKNFWG